MDDWEEDEGPMRTHSTQEAQFSPVRFLKPRVLLPIHPDPDLINEYAEDQRYLAKIDLIAERMVDIQVATLFKEFI